MFKVLCISFILAFIASSVCGEGNRVAQGSQPSSASSTSSVSSSSSSASSSSSSQSASSRSSSSSSSSSDFDSSSSDFGSSSSPSSSYNGPSLFELIFGLFGGSNRRRNRNQTRRTGAGGNRRVANNRRAGTNQIARNNQRLRSNQRSRSSQRAKSNQRIRSNNALPSQDINPKAFFRGEIHPVNYCVTRYPGGQCWLICGGQWTRCRTQSPQNSQKSTIFLKAEPAPAAPPIPSIPPKKVEPIQDWSDWSGWSHCSKSCGGGTKKRSRSCQSQDKGCDMYGSVSSQQVITCNTNLCPVKPEPIQDWSDWSGWSHCSKFCGGGTKKRSRSCQSQDKGCDMDGSVSSQQIITCNTNLCPVPKSTKPAMKLPSMNSITKHRISVPIVRSKNKFKMEKQATKNNKAFEGGVSCGSSTVCTLAYSCQWYLEQVEQIEGLERSAQKYQEVVKELKQNVCNKEKKMICCPLLVQPLNSS